MKKTMRIGEVSKAAGVCGATVRKWVDLGVLKGFRIPYSNDRRVYTEDFLKFAAERNMNVVDVHPERTRKLILFVGIDSASMTAFQVQNPGFNVVATDSTFIAGLIVGRMNPDAVVVNASIGRIESSLIAKGIEERVEHAVTLIAMVDDEDRNPSGFGHYVAKGPHSISVVAGLISADKSTN